MHSTLPIIVSLTSWPAPPLPPVERDFTGRLLPEGLAWICGAPDPEMEMELPLIRFPKQEERLPEEVHAMTHEVPQSFAVVQAMVLEWRKLLDAIGLELADMASANAQTARRANDLAAMLCNDRAEVVEQLEKLKASRKK